MQILDICDEENLTGLELSSGLEYMPDFERVLNRLKSHKSLLIHNYFPPPRDSFVLNLGSSDPYVIKQSIALCCTAIDLCSRLGIPFYSVHGGFSPPKDTPISKEGEAVKYQYDFAEAYENLCENVTVINAYAKERGVRLLVENNEVTFANLDDEGSPRFLMAGIDEIEHFFEEIADPNVGLMVDVGHVNISARTLGFERDAFLARLAGHIGAFHVSENNSMFDLNEPVREDSWFLPHLKHFPDAYVILEAYRLSVSEIKSQRNLIEHHLAKELV